VARTAQVSAFGKKNMIALCRINCAFSIFFLLAFKRTLPELITKGKWVLYLAACGLSGYYDSALWFIVHSTFL